MFYCQSNIDRADHLRKDPSAILALLNQDNARLIPVCDGKSLTSTGTGSPAALMLRTQCLEDDKVIFLGKDDKHSYFAVDISALDETGRNAFIADATDTQGISHQGIFQDLRTVGPLLNPYEGSLMAYARALVYWNNHARFCIRCGNTLSSSNGGHVRNCTQCDHIVFPRTDPAVIMLVTYTCENEPDLCLLGRSHAWPEGVFSTLAGFVEPGESLEMAVQREVLEEASIHTEDVRYVASQPWPFPRSIMLGFEAVATTTEIRCDPTELEDAQWFTREQIRRFGNWADDSDGYKLPRTDSIARYLIDRWVARDA
ncbi:MAG: NAD(+) diphosphatase [Granulosicoccus sp.]